jgi:diadenosine tetraphosphatase ApaH/serine/threonine PP2A family protein phosphatase
MPRIAVISDLHANLEACQALRADLLKDDSVREVYCLGDFVGYGPSPNEVVDLVLSMERDGFRMRHAVGNHDIAAIGRCEFVDLQQPETLQRVCQQGGFADKAEVIRAYLNPETRKYVPVKAEAEQTMSWTLRQITEPTRSFLGTRLEERIEIQPGVIAVHASPRDSAFEYVRDAKTATRAFESSAMDGVRVCFIGHTHLPIAWSLPAEDRVSYAGRVIVTGQAVSRRDQKLKIASLTTLYLVNVGSVGQARGEDRRAGYVIYDTDASTVEFRRVEYDSATTVAKIRKAGLPNALAGRFGAEDVDA